MAEQPNILFLFADQMHAFALGCMGHPQVKTPYLDKLAAQGVLFRHMYSCAPVCTPYRGTLFTGMYASKSGVERNVSALPVGVPTLADRLNEAGYRTSYVGKWHLGGKGNIAVPRELRGGFQDFIGYQCYNEYIRDVVFFDEEDRPRVIEAHRTEATTELAIERLRRVDDERFAMFVSYQNPHYPVQPAEQFERMYSGLPVVRRLNAIDIDPYTGTESPRSNPDTDPNKRKYGSDLDEYLRLYYAMITQLDENVGRLLAELEALGLAENTVVVFTSDHGDMQGSHGLKNKSVFWEESVRVPLIVRAPGGLVGRKVTQLVSSLDLYPTILDYCGAACGGMEGVSFAPLTYGEEIVWDDTVFAEDRQWRMVRQGAYKLAADRASGAATHLFDLENDPYELNNLLGDPGHADRVVAMRDEILRKFA
jgi:arylsulfatase A-like enzyme